MNVLVKFNDEKEETIYKTYKEVELLPNFNLITALSFLDEDIYELPSFPPNLKYFESVNTGFDKIPRIPRKSRVL